MTTDLFSTWKKFEAARGNCSCTTSSCEWCKHINETIQAGTVVYPEYEALRYLIQEQKEKIATLEAQLVVAKPALEHYSGLLIQGLDNRFTSSLYDFGLKAREALDRIAAMERGEK